MRYYMVHADSTTFMTDKIEVAKAHAWDTDWVVIDTQEKRILMEDGEVSSAPIVERSVIPEDMKMDTETDAEDV